MFLIIVLLVFIFVLLCFVLSLLSPKFKLDGSHVLITGGSSGIGRAMAIEVVKQGANVTILARNKKILEEAKAEIQKHVKNGSSQKVATLSVDLTKDYNLLRDEIKKVENDQGPVDVLINCAGFAINGRFEEIPVEEFKKQMDINYLGSVNPTKAVIDGMMARRRGRIVFVSSQAGQLGIFGFTAYSPSKYALRGLAESLQMEVKPYNIGVTVAFPPDTDTPGYKEELKFKPEETRLISAASGLFQPDYVAKTIIRDMQKGRYLSYVGIDGWMLAILTCGMSPVGSLFDAIQQVLTMSIFRLVSLFYLISFDGIVAKCKKQAEQQVKEKTS